MSTYVYYMNSSLVSSSVCIGSSTDHRPTCLGIALLAVPSLDSVEVLVLVVLSLVMVVVLSGPCRVFIWLFSRLPRKEGQYYIADYITLHTLFLLPPYIFYVSESGYMWTENMIAHLRPPMTNNQNKKTHLSYMYVHI